MKKRQKNARPSGLNAKTDSEISVYSIFCSALKLRFSRFYYNADAGTCQEGSEKTA